MAGGGPEKHHEENRGTARAAAAVGAFLAAVILFWVIPSLRWDFFFDLNDDVLMKDLLSGVYTGEPETHNIQMLYPVALLISGLYRIFPGTDVFGFFLQAVQVFCTGALILRAYETAEKHLSGDSVPGQRSGRFPRRGIAAALFMAAGAGVLFLRHYVFFQYTLTVGLLGGCAAFFFITMELPAHGEPRYFVKFVKACAPSVLFASAGFLIRSEMMLLMLPMVLTGAFFALLRSLTALTDGSPLRRYLRPQPWEAAAAVVLCMAFVMALGWGADRLSTSGSEWREFTDFFDARTELYDYNLRGLLPYESDSAFYSSEGIGESQTELLFNYNFGLDTSIDSVTMQAVADHAGEVLESEQTGAQKLKNALWDYRQTLTGSACSPMNRIVLLGYLLCLFSAVPGGVRSGTTRALQLLFLFAVRSVPWMYICLAGRAPERLTHSLFLEEFLILAGILILDRKNGKAFPAVLLTLACLAALPGQVRYIDAETVRRAEVNAACTEFREYCGEHPDIFYFEDVYSTVAYSETLYGADGRSGEAGIPANDDLLGGWAAGSPLARKKLSCFGYDDPADALLSENCRFAAEPGADVSFLERWYLEERGLSVTVTEEDSAGDGFLIYRVQRTDDNE